MKVAYPGLFLSSGDTFGSVSEAFKGILAQVNKYSIICTPLIA